MSRKLIPVLLVLAILLTACSNPSTPQTVEVTRVVEVTRMVEVTRVVEAPAQPAATVAPATPAPAPPAPQAPGFGETLKKVTARGKLNCGVNSQVPGFGFVDSSGAYAGFDVDFCKALAAAIFNDVSKIEYRPVTAEQRFPALQSGEIDVLIRNTTWTLVRDTDNGGNFVATTFYDGQGMMVPKSLNATKLEDLASGTICVQKGTTTELNLAVQGAARPHGAPGRRPVVRHRQVDGLCHDRRRGVWRHYRQCDRHGSQPEDAGDAALVGRGRKG